MITLGVIVTFLSSSELLAETTKDLDKSQLSPLRDIPGPKDEATEFFITKDNAYSFNEFLLQPLMKGLVSGQLFLRTVSQLDFQWKTTQFWSDRSTRNVKQFQLDPQGNLLQVGQQETLFGYPFGHADDVNKEKDTTIKGYEILWNMQLGLYPEAEVLYDLELAWVGDKALLRTSKGSYYAKQYKFSQLTVANNSEQGLDGEIILRRDVLKLFEPAPVFGFAALSERYLGVREDQFWIYSPVIERSRKISSSNRGDELVGELLSYDDILGWSAKIQTITPKVLAEKEVLVAFPSLKMYRLQLEPMSKFQKFSASGGQADIANLNSGSNEGIEQVLTAKGQHKKIDTSPVSVLWNYETRKFPGAFAWMPTTTFFIPRKVWIVELDCKDPYYPFGRQLLFVDQETFLPVYKIVYDQKGNMVKFIMAGWGLASSETGDVRQPFLGFLVVAQANNMEAVTITTKALRTFQGKVSPLSKEYDALLDISSHEKQKLGASSISATQGAVSSESSSSTLQASSIEEPTQD